MADDPGLQWPAWKFGMKREEIFTTLQERYNTITSSIQDPEAFHHDVYEISHAATSPDEFHRLLADRKEQRIRELNSTLESASFEIIANPSLIGTEQWQFAVQLFRTRSLDSLVRYFASYLPDDHPWYNPQTRPSSDQASGDGSFRSTSVPEDHLPPSPRSMTMCSDESAAASPIDDDSHRDYSLNTYTPARTASFSEPETDFMAFSGLLSHVQDDETSQSAGPDTPTTSVSDFSETQSLSDYDPQDEIQDDFIAPTARDGGEAGEDIKGTQEEDAEALAAPTPRGGDPSDSYVNAKPTSGKHGRSSSLHNQVLLEYARSSSRRPRRDRSPGMSATRRRSPEVGRVQKPSTEPARPRPKGLVHMSRLQSRYP